MLTFENVEKRPHLCLMAPVALLVCQKKGGRRWIHCFDSRTWLALIPSSSFSPLGLTFFPPASQFSSSLGFSPFKLALHLALHLALLFV